MIKRRRKRKETNGDEEESEDVNGMVHLIHNQVLFEPV